MTRLRDLFRVTPEKLRRRAHALRAEAREHVREAFQHSAEGRRLQREADELDARAADLERSGDPRQPQGP